MKQLILSLFLAIVWIAIPAHAQTTTVTGSFKIFVNDASCTTAMPCTLQLYRGAGPASGTSCPSLATPGAYTEILTNTLGTTITATSTQWIYLDPLTNVAPDTTYCYSATLTYVAGGGPSGSLGGLAATVPFPVPSAASSVSATWVPGA